MYKYPRTPHIQGSRPQSGDEDLEMVPFEAIAGRHLIIQEKVDGANAGIWFDAAGNLNLQSRGHVLTGGPRERQFDLFKAWAARHYQALFRALGNRYVLYGEWLYAKHAVFYDALPHYFLAFEVLDRPGSRFLDTESRHALLGETPVVSVPVLYEGTVRNLRALESLVGPSPHKSPAWKERLRETCESLRMDADVVLRETDASDLMEGLYIKVEENREVVGRYKFVRASYASAVPRHDRPLIPNQLQPEVDLFAERSGRTALANAGPARRLPRRQKPV